MNKVRVHRVNFFEHEPKAIHSMAYDESTARLAVSRSDFSIEIWNLQHKPFLEKVLPTHPHYSVETIVWSKSRLFSAGLHGYIIEYNLKTLLPKEVIAVTTSCSVWCLGVNKQHSMLAAGTEDGRVCIYQIASGSLDFEKLLSKQEGRILCLDWHVSGDILVTGSIDAIRVWDVKTGQISERIIVGRSEKNIETIVWCIAVTSDMTIISGDSRGRTCFWDGEMGTMISSSAPHKADVLSLCLSHDESIVYTAGVDPVIIMFAKSQMQHNSKDQGKSKWMRSVQRNVHTHDVRAIQLAGDYLVSGGVDTHLVFSKYPPKTVISYSPFSQVCYTSVSSDASSVLLKYPEKLELWELGKTYSKAGNDGEHLPLDEHPMKKLLLKAKSNESIICSAISKNGRWIAYSSLQQVRLFYLSEDADGDSCAYSVEKVKFMSGKVEPSTAMVFTPCGKLVLATFSGKILVMECALSEPQVIFQLKNDSEQIHLLTVSPDGSFLAAAACDGNISTYDLSAGQIHTHLPFYKCHVTAMKFDIDSVNLIAVYSDRKVVEFDLKNQAYSNWCRNQCISDFQDCSPYSIRGITFMPQNKDLLILYDEDALYVIDKSVTSEHSKKRAKASDNSYLSDETVHYKVIKKFKYLLDFCHLTGDEMVAVEVKLTDIHCALPPPLYHKKYGT